MYGDRVNNTDLRVAKIVRIARTKTLLSLDLYNLFNVNPTTSYNNAYATWLAPVAIQQARFIKLGVQFDF